MTFKRYGADQVGDWIDANVDQAMRLWTLVQDHDDFEAAAKPAMSAICIRYRPPDTDLDEDRLARLHHEVARRIEQSGRFWITTTFLKGRWWFRINPVNLHTRLEHMDELLELIERECSQLHAEAMRPGAPA